MSIALGLIDWETVARNWWMVLLRGLVAILFGAITFAAPGLSLAALVLVWGGFALADGVLALGTAFSRRRAAPWWVLIVQGVAGIGAGVLTFAWPGITALVLLYVIAAWALVTGVFEISAAIRLRKSIDDEWLLGLSGVASVILGGLLFLSPGAGALAVVLWIGAYALVSGVLLVGLSFRLRSLATRVEADMRAARPISIETPAARDRSRVG
jgi:uncharacterized membrane protein HdeD (DUF308 family)